MNKAFQIYPWTNGQQKLPTFEPDWYWIPDTLFGQWGTLFSLTNTLTSPEGITIAMLSNTHIWKNKILSAIQLNVVIQLAPYVLW
jgi:hypothetical protein